MERRRHDRHEVQLPVEMTCGQGLTRDMSVSGAYIEAPIFDVPVGGEFTFSVTFGRADASSWVLRCQGLVIRIEDKGDHLGIAASIERYLEINSGNGMAGIEHEH